MTRTLAFAAVALLLSGCGSSAAPTDPVPSGQGMDAAAAPEPVTPTTGAPAPSTDHQVTTADAADTSCTAEIGAAAAERLVNTCRQVSPATRPPCNAANSCEMIRGEIARGKAFIAKTDAAQATDEDAQGPAAAADVVRRYYAAIDVRDFETAYGLWGDGGQASGQSRTAFSRGLSHTSSANVTIGALGRPEGAAGSVYVTVPVTVNSVLEDGTRQRFTGEYVLRRAQVPSASAAKKRWHIESANLKKAG